MPRTCQKHQRLWRGLPGILQPTFSHENQRCFVETESSRCMILAFKTTDRNEKKTKKKEKSAVMINLSYNEETGQPMSWHWQDDPRKAAQPTGKLKTPKVRRTCCAAHRCSNRQLLGRAVCVSAQRRPFLAWTLQPGGSHCVEGGSWTQAGNYFHEKSPSQEANTLLGHELVSQVAGYSAG